MTGLTRHVTRHDGSDPYVTPQASLELDEAGEVVVGGLVAEQVEHGRRDVREAVRGARLATDHVVLAVVVRVVDRERHRAQRVATSSAIARRLFSVNMMSALPWSAV